MKAFIVVLQHFTSYLQELLLTLIGFFLSLGDPGEQNLRKELAFR